VADPMSTERPSRDHRARRRRLAAAAILLLVLALVGPGPAPAQEGPTGDGDDVSEAELRDQYEELVGAEADLLVAYDQVSARLEELLPQVAAAEAAAREAEAAVTEAEAAVEVAQADLEDSQEVQDEAEADLAAAEERERAAEDRLRRFAVESYIGESAQASEVADVFAILDGDDGSLARAGYRGSIGDQQQRLIQELEAARRAGARAVRRARAATATAQEQRDVVERRRAQVEQRRQDAVAALAETTRLVEETAAERDRQALLVLDIQSRKVSIEARIISLDRAADGVAQLLAAYQAGDPDWVPGAVDVALPCTGCEIGSEFGQRAHPILNVTRLHAGADIGAASGSPVLAAADGVVLFAGERGGYGNTVVLAHGNTLGTVYAHNSAFSVQVGNLVTQGQEIARAGSTGLSTGPHIHFETRLRGVPVNPRNFLPPPDGTGIPGPDPDAPPVPGG